MTDMHVNGTNSSTLVYVIDTKWADQTLHSSEVNEFFKIVSYNINFCVVDCALFVHCAFVAEKNLEDFSRRCEKERKTWLVGTRKCEKL